MYGMTHAILDTPLGYLLATTDDRGVLVLARTLPRHLRDDYDGLRAFVNEGGVYVVAFGDAPGAMHALRVPPGWDGEHVGRDSLIRRPEAVAAVGEEMIHLCCYIAGELATKAFPSWQDDADKRDAGLKAVLSRLPVGEA